MALAVHRELIDHVFRINEFSLPSGVWLECGGVQIAPSYGAPSLTTVGGGLYTSTALNSAATFTDLITNANQVMLRGTVAGSDMTLYYWFLPSSIAAGSSVTFNANSLPITVNANTSVRTEGPRDVVKHLLGTAQLPRPDHLYAALGKEAFGVFTELAEAGYSRQDVDGIWTATSDILPAEDRTYVRNNAEVIFGPAGTEWTGNTDWQSAYIVDSGGTPWWRILGSLYQTVPAGNRLKFEVATLFGWAYE